MDDIYEIERTIHRYVHEDDGKDFACRSCGKRFFYQEELIPCRFFDDIGDDKTYLVCRDCHEIYLEEKEEELKYDRECEDLIQKIDNLINNFRNGNIYLPKQKQSRQNKDDRNAFNVGCV